MDSDGDIERCVVRGRRQASLDLDLAERSKQSPICMPVWVAGNPGGYANSLSGGVKLERLACSLLRDAGGLVNPHVGNES